MWEDVHRFFRYMIPGLMFILEMFFLLWLLFPQGVVCVLEKTFLTERVGSPLMLIFTSGVIGWFFSVIYRILFNLEFLRRFYPDHRAMIIDARIRKHLEMHVYGRAWKRIPPLLLTRQGAWKVVSSLWHGSGLIPKSAFKNQERQSNYMHSFGAVIVSSFIALIVWLAIAIFVSIQYYPRDWLMLLSGLVFSLSFILASGIGYIRALDITQGFVEIVLATKLDENQRNNGRPVTIVVFPCDFSD